MISGAMKKAFKWGIVAAVAVAIIAAIIAVVLVVLMKNKEDNSDHGRPQETTLESEPRTSTRPRASTGTRTAVPTGTTRTSTKYNANLNNFPLHLKPQVLPFPQNNFPLSLFKLLLQVPINLRRQHRKSNQRPRQDLDHQPLRRQLRPRKPQGLLRSTPQTSPPHFANPNMPSPTGATLSTRASTSTEQSSTSLETTSASISTEQASTKPLQTTTSGTDQSQKTTSEIESKTSTRPRSSSASKTTIPTTTTSPSTKYTTNPTSSLSLQPSEPTEPPSPTPTLNPNGLYCLLVGDMYNFNDKAAYEWEAIHIEDIGMFFFRESPISKIGLWAYGHTDYPKTPDLNRMSSNYREHRQECGNMKYRHRSDPLTTSSAIRILNELPWNKSAAKCLIFISAQKDTHSLPQLNPQNKTLKRIVAIGHNS
ncbi:hypothetical protein Y032_0389g524 [Ancylostoma ceylanicum]|uniref:Uncharacterized protein n=1 Tax=Ancylostoma ceylanicum TaxID=53326 RepID=A0A016RS50_9BILA|nr:hypothetical protein Y032_0389g524 [Ancylostoma ceylanicum]